MDELLELFNDPTQWGFTDNKMKKSLQSMISAYGPGGMFEGKFDSPEYKRDISMFSIYNDPKYKQDDQSLEGWQDLQETQTMLLVENQYKILIEH